MASGFKNSAGTDLDSLFLTNNSNAGAIGFKVSGGQDLGNRYSNATPKLGQTTGYKNSAGTDLGNLRSNKKPTSSGSVTVKVTKDYIERSPYLEVQNQAKTVDGVTLYIYGSDTSGGALKYCYVCVGCAQSLSNLTVDGKSYHSAAGMYKYNYATWDTSTFAAGAGQKTITISFIK
jgi:hypothetical protein